MTSVDQPYPASLSGCSVNLPNLQCAIQSIIDAALRGESFNVLPLTFYNFIRMRTDEALRRAYRMATFVTADGELVATLARRQQKSFVSTMGTDLVLPIAEAAASAEIPIFLFGPPPSVLGTAGRRLVENTDGRLEIVGSLSPGEWFEPQGADADAAIDRIAASGAKICFVALPSRNQELFAARAQERGVKVGFVCLGAGLHILAGEPVCFTCSA